jgi:3-dehydroquinate synthetase
LCSGQDSTRVEAHLKAVGLPTRIRDIPGLKARAEDILSAMRQDKKVDRGRLTFILARGVGESIIAPDIDERSVLGFLKEDLQLPSD